MKMTVCPICTDDHHFGRFVRDTPIGLKHAVKIGIIAFLNTSVSCAFRDSPGTVWRPWKKRAIGDRWPDQGCVSNPRPQGDRLAVRCVHPGIAPGLKYGPMRQPDRTADQFRIRTVAGRWRCR